MLRNNTVSRADLSNDRKGILDIHYGDVLIRYRAVVDVSTLQGPSINITDNRFLGDQLTDGDIIMADTAEDTSAGKCVEIEGVMHRNVVAGLHTIPLRPATPSSHGYWGQYLNSASFRNQLFSKMQGTKVISLSRTTVSNATVRYPSLAEQRRIGDIFSTLDNLIAAAERQEALLRQKKQAYLQLMFPREGETEPRLRFAGFSGEWQRRKLRELVSEGSIALKRGEVIPRQTGKYPVYSSSASEDGLFCTSDSFMFDQELVTWSIDGGGKPFYRQHHRFSVTNVCGYALILNPQTLTYRFLGLAMGRAWARAHFDYSSKAHPSVIEKIYILSIPSLPEQRCIGAFFSTLDNLIAAAEKRTKSLHTLKSSYLQRMFV